MREAETADQIDEAAFAWVARLDRCGADAELRQALEAWLSQDERRRGALLRAQAIWGKLDRASQADGARRRVRRLDRRAALVGTGAALAAGVTGVWFVTREVPYTTAIGEIRHVPLPDTSRMVLNTQSRAQVAMLSAERRVRLTQGEAWFRVAKDASRPFVVEAGRVRVQAVGTAFSVRRVPSGAEVLVSEGVVQAWLLGAEDRKALVAAGEQARVIEGQPILVQAAGPQIERKLAWRSEKIDLAGETLAQAIGEFNRYNRRKLVLADPQIADRRLYGIFRADDPEAFAQSVSLSLGAGVRLAPDQITIGIPRSPSSAI